MSMSKDDLEEIINSWYYYITQDEQHHSSKDKAADAINYLLIVLICRQ